MQTLPQFISDFDNIHLLCLEGSYDEIQKCLYTDPAAARRHNENGLQPLHLVVQRDYDDLLDVVNLILAYNADVNGRTAVEGDTALHLVIRTLPAEKASNIVRRLIYHGANPRIRNKRLSSAFDEAVTRGYIDLADLLNSDRWIRDRQALITAVCGGTIGDVLRCLRLGADVDKKTEVGAAAIHYVVSHRLQHNKIAVLKLLIQNNAYINARNREGDTVLNMVIKELGDDDDIIDIIKYLLDNGVNPKLRNKYDKNARDLASERRNDDIVEVLDGKWNVSAQGRWFKAVKMSQVDEIKQLGKERGNKKNIYNEAGMTPLHVCVDTPPHNKQSELITSIVQGGIDIDAKTEEEGDTSLHLAARHNNHLAAELLLKLDANTYLKNRKGQTAIDVCDKFHNKKVKTMILAKQKGSKSCVIL